MLIQIFLFNMWNSRADDIINNFARVFFTPLKLISITMNKWQCIFFHQITMVFRSRYNFAEKKNICWRSMLGICIFNIITYHAKAHPLIISFRFPFLVLQSNDAHSQAVMAEITAWDMEDMEVRELSQWFCYFSIWICYKYIQL